ncbi:MAG TPA: class II aldolase/adducin family protein [Candidatus Acidoferrales bacterium]|nr:class II aldolase/adducin family protein [Candidatus Acidoferrales bacterium]
MLKTEEEHRREICEVGRWIYDRGYVAGTDGNISVRLDARRILTSPTCLNKGMMTPGDMVIIDYDGAKLSGDRKPSSEMGMHLLIYRRRPDVNAICHAHPPTATGYAAAGIPLNRAMLAELVATLGCVPLASYGTPGTPELAAAIEPLVANHDAMLLANHGVVAYGQDLLTAFFRMDTVEHSARIGLVSRMLGKQVLLSQDEVGKLLACRTSHNGHATAEPPRLVTAGSPAAQDFSAQADSCASTVIGTVNGDEHVTLTRAELDGLIEEAIRKDRSRR